MGLFWHSIRQADCSKRSQKDFPCVLFSAGRETDHRLEEAMLTVQRKGSATTTAMKQKMERPTVRYVML